jgi:hypothetical protein
VGEESGGEGGLRMLHLAEFSSISLTLRASRGSPTARAGRSSSERRMGERRKKKAASGRDDRKDKRASRWMHTCDQASLRAGSAFRVRSAVLPARRWG